jgi:hypothetical protein
MVSTCTTSEFSFSFGLTDITVYTYSVMAMDPVAVNSGEDMANTTIKRPRHTNKAYGCLTDTNNVAELELTSHCLARSDVRARLGLKAPAWARL